MTREYLAWAHAKQRCTNPRATGYKDYGGRGITMCKEWAESFEAFFDDMGLCPPGYSIERIDVNGHYEPENCKWADTIDQRNNRRDNRFIEVEGERMTIAQASRKLGVPAHRLYARQ
jgi:hypothetical protein